MTHALRIDPLADGPQYLGIEIGGTKLQIVVGDAQGQIIDRWRDQVAPKEGGNRICLQIEQGLEELRRHHQVQAVGVGFGGPVDVKFGIVRVSHQVPGWESFGINQWLREVTGLPVAVDNDANVAALGESLNGAGVGANPMFYTNMGSGVGGGLIVNGQIYHGDVPGECEFGHLRLDRTGATVESRCSGWAIDARIRQAVVQAPESPLAKLVADKIGGEAKHLRSALDQNDPLALHILAELADDLAFALSHVVHLLHPQRIVIGGGLSLIGERLRQAVAANLPARIMAAFAPGPAVCLASLGEDAVPVGALRLARSITEPRIHTDGHR